LDVAAVAGLPGGIFRGEQVPGASGDKFIEDALEYGAFVDGRAAAEGWKSGPVGRPRRSSMGDGGLGQEGLDGLPVLVGEAHGMVGEEKG
jgi:hypothetical protein